MRGKAQLEGSLTNEATVITVVSRTTVDGDKLREAVATQWRHLIQAAKLEGGGLKLIHSTKVTLCVKACVMA